MRGLRVGATAAVLLLALAATGCGSDNGETLATVNGQTVNAAELATEIDGIRSIDGLFRDYGLSTFPPGGNDLPADVAAQVLTGLMQDKLLHQLRVDRNLQTSDACRQAAHDNLGLELSQVAGGGDPNDLVNRLPEAYRESRLSREEDQVLLGSAFVDTDGDGNPDGVDCDPAKAVDSIVAALVCVKAMPVASQDQGTSVVQQVQSGADFDTLAAQVAPGQPPDAQCGAKASFIGPIQQAKVGDVLGPLLVNGQQLEVVQTVDPQSVRATVQARLPNAIRDGLGRARQIALQGTTGKVDPRIGRWDTATAAVVPSGGTAQSSTESSSQSS